MGDQGELSTIMPTIIRHRDTLTDSVTYFILNTRVSELDLNTNAKWDKSGTLIGDSVSQNVLKTDLKKSQICPI